MSKNYFGYKGDIANMVDSKRHYYRMRYEFQGAYRQLIIGDCFDLCKLCGRCDFGAF